MKQLLLHLMGSACITCVSSIYSQIIIENESNITAYITSITVVQSQGLKEIPVPYTKDIALLPKEKTDLATALGNVTLPIREITISLNGIPHRFTFTKDEMQPSIIRITQAITIEVSGPVHAHGIQTAPQNYYLRNIHVI